MPTSSSFFACYTCGLEESFLDTMRRASSSRREQAYQSPVVRSRSSERLGEQTPAASSLDDILVDHDDNNDDDDQEDEFLDASQNFAESTDNDSAAVDYVNGVTTLSTSSDDDAIINKHSQRSSSNQVKRGYHHRAMSDPFDTQEMQDALEEHEVDDVLANGVTSTAAIVRSHMAYPTLLRYPVAETRNKNCWSEPPVTIFSVRGLHYFSDKKKQTSAPYLLSARGTDIFLFDNKPVRLQERSHLILGGHLRSVPTLLINFQFPWGVMVLYFEVPAKLAPYITNPTLPLAANLNHAERTFAKWLQGDDNYKNDRLKLIPYVAEGPWVVRNMVTGRPAIIGRKLPVTYRTLPGGNNDNNHRTASGSGGIAAAAAAAPLCECTLDIGSSSATAKRIVSVCRRYMSGLSADIGFVIQAETRDELPEQMLGSIRVHGPDPLKAPKI